MADNDLSIIEAIDLLEDTPADSQTETLDPIGAGTNTFTLAPLTGQAAMAMRQRFDAYAQQRSASKKSLVAAMEREDLGQRTGVPLDTESGTSPELRRAFAKMPSPQEGLVALQNTLGDRGTVRLNSFQQPVITVHEGGQEKDVLVNPLGPDLGDAVDLLSRTGEIGGGILGTVVAALATRGASLTPSIMRTVGQLAASIGGSVAGTAAGGVAQDVAVRSGEGLPVQAEESVRRRVGEMPMNAALETAFGVGGRALGFAISPASQVSTRTFDATAAQAALKNRYGIEIPLSVGERTGSSLLMKAEALATQQPGSSMIFERFLERRAAAVRQLRDIAQGGAPPDIEQAGRRGLAALGAEAAPIEQNVQRAAAQAGRTAEGEITPRFAATPVNRVALGNDLRAEAFAARERFQTEAARRYDAVFNDPRTATKNITGDQLAQDARALREELPTVTEGGEQVTLESFVPDRVMPMIQELERGAGQSFRLDELMQMRREIDNQIAQGEAIPGYQTRYLSRMRGMLTDRIQTGLREIDPGLEAAWQTANDYYAQNVQRFQRHGIAEMFRTPEQGGFVEASSIVNRATSGKTASDFYQAYRDFYGAGSPQMQQLRTAIADDVLGRSPLSETIDAKGLVRRLEALAKDAPDVLDDTFGTTGARQLRSAAQVLRASRGETLPQEELVEALNSGQLSGQRLSEMLSAEAARTQRYRNTILKAVNDGSLTAERIQPTEFVDRLVFSKGTQPSDLNEVMGMLSAHPDVVEDMRRLTFKKVLDDATVRRPNGIDTLDADALNATLQDENLRKRLTSVLGPRGMDDINDLRRVMTPQSVQQRTFRAAGQMASSSQILGFIRGGEFKYVTQATKNFLLAAAYSSPGLRSYVGNTMLSATRKADVANLAIASGPFIQALLETYGTEKAMEVQSEIKQSIDRSRAEESEPLDIEAAIQQLQ